MPRLLLAVLVLCAGCQGEAPTAPAPRAPAASAGPAFETVADMHQMMEGILLPAAEVIWDSAGFVITADGEADLSPTTDAEWEQVEDGAALVAESGNLLMLPGRARGDDWVAFSQQMIGAARGALAAAEAQDAAALFDAGGEVYQACRACHDVYWTPLLDARRAAE